MTAREKLEIEHPELVDVAHCGGCKGCPDHYGYLPCPSLCEIKRYPAESTCDNCWDREIPEEKENIMYDRCEENQCTYCIHEEVCSMKQRLLDAQRAVHELVIYSELPDGKIGQVKLRDIGFIKPVELVCIHYIPKDTTFMR